MRLLVMKKITATLCILSMLIILTACMNTEYGADDSVYTPFRGTL